MASNAEIKNFFKTKNLVKKKVFEIKKIILYCVVKRGTKNLVFYFLIEFSKCRGLKLIFYLESFYLFFYFI